MTLISDRQLQARAHAIISGGRLRHVSSQPPLTLRQVFSESPGTCALCLVGSAAGPLPGDDLLLRLEIGDGSTAALTAAGATIAQGGTQGPGAAPARLRTEVTVGAGASLCADPGALIVCAGAYLDLSLDLTLDPSASVIWRETLVLGRAGEQPGAVTLLWNVTVAQRPLLRQRLDLTHGTSWPGLVANARTVVTELCHSPSLRAETTVHSPTDVTQAISENATLRTTLR